MAETITVGEMAELASERVFSVFGWERHPLTNQNCACVDQVRHRKQRKSTTHPTDCVFSYVNPYSGKVVFVNADLKSYAVSTLEATDIPKAVRNLGHATECANRNAKWQDLFIGRECNHEVIGMLFIYNHDQNYDASFAEKLAALPPSSFELLPGTFVGVVGPQRISYLNSVAQDIKALHSDGKLPGKDFRTFFYPHLNRTMALHQHHNAAPLQALLSPLIVLCYEFPNDEKKSNAQTRGIYAYYDGRGETIEEFKYLLSYFFKYQLASEGTEIFVSCALPAKDAAVFLENAKKEYAREYWPFLATSHEECLSKLDCFKYRSVTNFVMRFEERELGMRWPET
jgi:hypothetical protein